MTEELRREGWRRLGIEGLVIVFSILLALAVDAAWERHLDRRRLSSSLDQLREQLAANREELSAVVDRNSDRSSRLREFLRSSPEELREMPLDSLRPIPGAFLSLSVYDQGGIVAETFVGGGLLDLVADPDLRRLLILWSTVPRELAADRAAIGSIDELLQASVADHAVLSAAGGIPGAGALPARLAEMRADPRAAELVLLRLAMIESYGRQLEQARADVLDPLADRWEQR